MNTVSYVNREIDHCAMERAKQERECSQSNPDEAGIKIPMALMKLPRIMCNRNQFGERSYRICLHLNEYCESSTAYCFREILRLD